MTEPLVELQSVVEYVPADIEIDYVSFGHWIGTQPLVMAAVAEQPIKERPGTKEQAMDLLIGFQAFYLLLLRCKKEVATLQRVFGTWQPILLAHLEWRDGYGYLDRAPSMKHIAEIISRAERLAAELPRRSTPYDKELTVLATAMKGLPPSEASLDMLRGVISLDERVGCRLLSEFVIKAIAFNARSLPQWLLDLFQRLDNSCIMRLGDSLEMLINYLVQLSKNVTPRQVFNVTNNPDLDTPIKLLLETLQSEGRVTLIPVTKPKFDTSIYNHDYMTRLERREPHADELERQGEREGLGKFPYICLFGERPGMPDYSHHVTLRLSFDDQRFLLGRPRRPLCGISTKNVLRLLSEREQSTHAGRELAGSQQRE